MKRSFPRITPAAEKSLIDIAAILQENPEALKSPECKYSPKLTHALNIIMVVGATRNMGVDLNEEIQKLHKQHVTLHGNPHDPTSAQALTETDLSEGVDLELETRTMYHEMKKLFLTISGMETKEKSDLIKTSSNLLEKLINLQEKAIGINQFNHFKSFIVDSMDKYLTPVQKTEFVDGIEEILNKEK